MVLWEILCAIACLTLGIINCDMCVNDTSEKPKPDFDDKLDETFYQLIQIRETKHPQTVRGRGSVQTTHLAGRRYCPHGSRRKDTGSDTLRNEEALQHHLPSYMMRSSCPSYLVINHDENRIPEIMAQAVCACRKCGAKIHKKQKSRCRPVYYYRRVLRRVCDRKTRKYIYSTSVEPVSTGCTCVNPS